MRPKIVITQPYVPTYRVPLFENVINEVAAEGFDCHVFFGGTPSQMRLRALRGDGANVTWATAVRTRSVQPPFSPFAVTYRELPREWRRPAVLLTEMQATNGNAWMAAARRQPFITMGHGRSYTTKESLASRHLETAINRQATHVLTYLPSGRDAVLKRTRRSAETVTSFNNATDSRRLMDEVHQTTEKDATNLRSKLGIPPGARVSLFVGSLNSDKKIDFLIAAATELLRTDTSAWIIIAGAGPREADVRAFAIQHPRVVITGQIGQREFAHFSKIARVIVNPGRIGLVAVDSLATGLPILTLRGSQHAPEVEYLTRGRDLFESDDSQPDFVAHWRSLLQSEPTRRPHTAVPTIEQAASSIARVLITAARN